MSIPTCKFFNSEQGCKFGNKCRYKHSDPSHFPTFNQSNDQNQNNGSVRNFYSSRTSSYSQEHLTASREYEASVRNPRPGTNHFDHNHLSRVPSKLYEYDQVRLASSYSTAEGHLEEKFQGLEATDHSNEALRTSFHPVLQQRPYRKLCHYFARNGNCCFGSRCRFEHVQPSEIPPRFQQGGPRPQTSEVRTDEDRSPLAQDGKTEKAKGVRSSYPSKGFTSYKPGNPPRTGSATFRTANGKVQDDSSRADQHTKPESVHERTENKRDGKTENIKPDKICQFFVRGRCWKGRRCRFLHPRHQGESAKNNDVEDPQEPENCEQEENGSASLPQTLKDQDVSSQTSLAQNSHMTHSHDSEPSPKPSVAQKPRNVYVAQGTRKYRRCEVDDVEGCRLRRTEIEQLVKRFPKSKVKVNRDCAEYFQCIISFTPTDPDWPYDVKVFQLQVDIPSDYPFEMMTIMLTAEQDLPETVRRYVEVAIEEWLEDKERQLADSGQVELVFRPFLRWLDRNIEDVATEGLKQLKRELVAKAAGLEFISAKQLQKQYPGQSADVTDDEDDDNSSDDDETDSESEEEDSSSDLVDESDEEEPCDERVEKDEGEGKKGRKSQQDKAKAMMAEPERRGTEVTLKNLQLKESAATLYFEKVCLLIQCERCKATSEFMASCGRANMVQCGQCSQTQVATFRPAMAHHFSAVIGYLDLDACLPYDLILQNCSAVIACLHCSKDTKPGALMPGQPQDHWCRVCHHKLRVATDGVRFTQLEPLKTPQSLMGSVKVVVPSRKRIPKDPAILEGKPLPNFGTCKHYKKSYRWLRFPCCGKCYPCDVCHDSKEDHEMKFANRMVCGFCCKEQPYAAERPCKGCDMNMTRVHTQHWEGGQGCRDKISMSRNDKQKHRNMSKTVSKHAQKVKDLQSKKKTKLRHA